MTYIDYMKKSTIESIEKIQDEKILQYLYTIVMSSIHEETLQEDA